VHTHTHTYTHTYTHTRARARARACACTCTPLTPMCKLFHIFNLHILWQIISGSLLEKTEQIPIKPTKYDNVQNINKRQNINVIY